MHIKYAEVYFKRSRRDTDDIELSKRTEETTNKIHAIILYDSKLKPDTFNISTG